MKKKYFIFVTGGLWQLPAIKEAYNQGYKIIVIDNDSNAPGKIYSDHYINISLFKKEKILKKLENLNLNIRGVISYCSEAGMELASQIRSNFNLIGPNKNCSQILIDKEKQRRIISKKNNPLWQLFKNKKKLKKILINIKKTMVLKPCDSSGSKGVHKITPKMSEIQILNIIDDCFKHSKSKRVILEDFIAGSEFSVEVYFINNKINLIGITKKKKINSINNNVSEEIFNFNFSKKIEKNIISTIDLAYKKAQYTDGPGHAEIIIKDNRIYILEIAGRGPGFDMYDRFLKIHSGINLTKLNINHYSGKIMNKIKIKKKINCHIFFFKTKKGKVKKVIGLPKKTNIKGRLIKLFYKKNFCYNEASTDGDRFGYILVFGNTKNKNKQIINKFKKKIQFVMKK